MKSVTALLEAEHFKGAPLNITSFKQIVSESRRQSILAGLPSSSQTQLSAFYAAYDGYLPVKLAGTFPGDIKQLLKSHMDIVLAAHSVVAEEERQKQASLKRAFEEELDRREAELIQKGRDLQARNVRATTVNTYSQCASAVEAALQALQKDPPDNQRAIISLEDLLGYFRR